MQSNAESIGIFLFPIDDRYRPHRSSSSSSIFNSHDKVLNDYVCWTIHLKICKFRVSVIWVFRPFHIQNSNLEKNGVYESIKKIGGLPVWSLINILIVSIDGLSIFYFANLLCFIWFNKLFVCRVCVLIWLKDSFIFRLFFSDFLMLCEFMLWCCFDWKLI